MKFSPSPVAALTWVEVLVGIVVLVVLGLLLTLAIPAVSHTGHGSLGAGLMNNARQLQVAIQMMSLDTATSGEDGMSWTTRMEKGRPRPTTLGMVFDALTTNNYLSERDLKKLLTGPGVGPGGWSKPNARNIAFRFFPVDEESPSDQPLMVTANWDRRTLTDRAPLGRKRFVVFAKGGSGGVYIRPANAADPKIFPVGKGYRDVPME